MVYVTLLSLFVCKLCCTCSILDSLLCSSAQQLMVPSGSSEEDAYLSDDSVDPDNMTYEVMQAHTCLFSDRHQFGTTHIHQTAFSDPEKDLELQ